jgi:hypothetical protein
VLLPGRGGGGQLTNKINTSGVGRERRVSQLKKNYGRGIYQFVTIQLAKIVFQNFRCNEIKMKYAEI